MITVIMKDGTEVLVKGENEIVPYSEHGPNDLLVAIYRRDVQAWTIGRLMSLREGDFFRKLDMPESAEHAFLVTKAPRASITSFSWARRKNANEATVHLEGVTLVQLSKLPPVQARRLLEGPRANQEVITSHTRLLLEN
jgi:hypothetical protein